MGQSQRYGAPLTHQCQFYTAYPKAPSIQKNDHLPFITLQYKEPGMAQNSDIQRHPYR